MKKSAFTLLELLFIIIIIGVLAAFAIPKFSGLTSNSKVSSELATAATIQSAVDDVHSEWIMNEDSFNWGNNKNQDDVNDDGYPSQLGDCDPAFNWILKNSTIIDSKWRCSNNQFRGPASNSNSGVAENGEGKPDSNDCWEYDATNGIFSLNEGCN